jgi:hypothetical protein
MTVIENVASANRWFWISRILEFAALFSWISANKLTGDFKTGHVIKHMTKQDTDHVTSSVIIHKVQADDGSWIPSTYRDFLDIFSKKKNETLPPHRPTDHAIDLEVDAKLPYRQIYSLSEVELKALKAYIETNLASGFIRRSSLPAASPILFVKKKDGSLRLCVNYRARNHASVKTHYPLPLISEMLERVGKAKIFTKLDLRGVYNLIRIKEGDEFKTAF